MTLLTLSMPWPFLAIIFPVCLYAFHLMAQQDRVILVTSDEWDGRCTSLPPAIIWVYAAAAGIVLLAPVPAMTRLLSLFFCLFLFRMALTDALTGLLPREMTVSCLIAGLTAAFTMHGLVEHLLSATAALVIFGGWRYVTSKLHGRECLGLGDVWLAGAIGAWLSIHYMLYALLTGVVLFVLWQLSVRRTTEGGPMGPWLGAGAMLVTLLKLYHPLITW
ncbi:TPA: prepilin peptidase [Klebsiella pneumoniae]|nr:prepilin peptidase [Klebsiella pneumoniae]